MKTKNSESLILLINDDVAYGSLRVRGGESISEHGIVDWMLQIEVTQLQ